MTKKIVQAQVATATTPVVYASLDEVRIRSNAADMKVYVVMLREKMKDVVVKSGQVVAQALDKAGCDIDVQSPDQLDIRVNGKKAKLLQKLNQGDTIYVAPKVAGSY